MQISRHWRLNAQRYRLEGYRNTNGEVSLQRRPLLDTQDPQAEIETNTDKESRVAAVAH